jgi:endonuclease YncB( thermonuclease family)
VDNHLGRDLASMQPAVKPAIMPLSVIVGTYRLVGASPDGDSVRFYPDDPAVWTRSGIKAKPNAKGGVQLRLDAIDALETHYTPPSAKHQWHQPTRFGQAASARLLELLGFSDVTRNAAGTVTASTPDQTPGYILTRLADVYGRVVALAYPGSRSGSVDEDGTAMIGVPELRRSVNYQMLEEGLVYPTFYSKLYVDFRKALARAASIARDAHKGLWAVDDTLSGFTLKSADQLTNDLVILPKLFRRLAEYLTDADGSVDLAGFDAFLAAHGDDELYTVPDGRSTHLDTLIDVDGQHLVMTVPPEKIIFIEQ